MPLNEFFLKTLEEEGARLGISSDKKRALIREYLQTRIIAALYARAESANLSFIGGTSLRLLRGLDRFSEDLDFDNLGLRFNRIKKLFQDIASLLQREGFAASYDMKNTDSSGIGAVRLGNLLYELGISEHRDEKLSIKINYTTPGFEPKTELVTMVRFGFVQNVLTNTSETMLAQKIYAIFQRKDLQPRDFYDTAWFLSRHIRPDEEILKRLGIKDENEVFEKLKKTFRERIKPDLTRFRARLMPFLINPDKIVYLDEFENIVNSHP